MTGYLVYTVSTATWGDRQLVDAKSAPWKRTHNESAGGMQTSFKLSDPKVAAVYQAGALTPVERCLVVENDDVVLYAGIIWEDDYDNDSRILTVLHEDVWSLLALRLISADRGSTMASWKQTYSGLEYDTIIKRLVQLATSGAGRTLPIQYEADYTGGRSRTYYGYNLDLAIDAITEIMNLPGGPDVDLRPEWGSDGVSLQWTLRTGNMNPDSQTIEVFVDADQSAVKGLKRKRSGRERATRVMGVGEGSGRDIKIRAGSGAGSGAFGLDRVEQSKNIKNTADLQDFATGKQSARSALITQYSMDLNIDSPVIRNLWSLKPGAYLRWHTMGNPAIPDGWKQHKIIEYSGDTTSNWIHFELQ